MSSKWLANISLRRKAAISRISSVTVLFRMVSQRESALGSTGMSVIVFWNHVKHKKLNKSKKKLICVDKRNEISINLCIPTDVVFSAQQCAKQTQEILLPLLVCCHDKISYRVMACLNKQLKNKKFKIRKKGERICLNKITGRLKK